MADREKSTVPLEWTEEHLPCREVFLVNLPPAAAAACRRLGALAYLCLLESDYVEMSEPLQVRDMRALARDLRFLEGFAVWMGRDVKCHSLKPAEARLSLLAGSLAPRIGEIAAEMESALSSAC